MMQHRNTEVDSLQFSISAVSRYSMPTVRKRVLSGLHPDMFLRSFCTTKVYSAVLYTFIYGRAAAHSLRIVDGIVQYSPSLFTHRVRVSQTKNVLSLSRLNVTHHVMHVSITTRREYSMQSEDYCTVHGTVRYYTTICTN